MTGQSAVTIILPAVIGMLMFGLGLSLSLSDFARAARSRRAVIVTLACQLLLLPPLCFALVWLLGLDPPLAIGMLLLAATPGGTTAGLFSHLAGGDVALNITLTAINSLLATFTLPLIVNTSIAVLLPRSSASLGLSVDQALQLAVLVVVPVAIGMLVKAKAARFAGRANQALKVIIPLFLGLIAVAALTGQWSTIAANFGAAGSAAVLFCAGSLALGYWLPRLAGVSGPQAISAAMEVGIHNSGMAVAIALSPTLLNNSQIAVPAIIYAVATIPCAAIASYIISWRLRKDESPVWTPHPGNQRTGAHHDARSGD